MPRRCPACGSADWNRPRQQARWYYGIEIETGTVRRFATILSRTQWVIALSGRRSAYACSLIVRRLRRAEAEHGEQVWNVEE